MVVKKDANGAYIPIEPPKPLEQPSGEGLEALGIDTLLRRGLLGIKRSLDIVNLEIQRSSAGIPPLSRETVQNLKDIMLMLRELKKDEKDILDSLTEDELTKLLPENK